MIKVHILSFLKRSITARLATILLIPLILIVAPMSSIAATPNNTQLASILSSLQGIINQLRILLDSPVQAQTANITAGLVAHYKFDEGSGTSAGDSAGSNTGTISGATWTTGKLGQALNFDGVNDYVKVTQAPAINNLGQGSFTASAWVYPKGTTGANPRILDKSNQAASGWTLELPTGLTTVYFDVRHSTQIANSITSTSLPLNTWTHVVAVLDSSDTANIRGRIYFNGTLQPLSTNQRGIGTGPNDSLYDLGIGGMPSLASRNINGLIDDVRIYNRALLAVEIQTLYNLTPPPPPPSTDTQAPTVSITAPTNGTVSGTAVSVTATTSDNIGIVGVQFKLDGTNLGTEDTSSPYSVSWNTTSATNAFHTLTAVARDQAGNLGTSPSVTVTVNNVASPPPVSTPPGPPVIPQVPELPRAYVDTTMPDTTGYVTKTVCASGCDFTSLNTAVNHTSVKDATTGIIVSLKAGETFVGTAPQIILPVHRNPWVIIQSSAVGSLPPPGTRVTPAHAALMPKIVTTTTAQPQVIGVASGAHHYRFIGLEVTSAPGIFVYYLIHFAPGVVSDGSTLPHHLIVDRSYVHGDATAVAAGAPYGGGPFVGIEVNSSFSAVIDSSVTNIANTAQETQAINGWNGPGPFKIVNNYLEASGENIMFGGVDAKIPNMVPSDIEVRRNHMAKRLSWKITDPSYAGTRHVVKNLFELKNAQRVLIEGNLFEYNWVMAQDGSAILFTPRNQNGNAPWSVVQDVTFRHNIVRHAGGGIQLSGQDNNYPSQPTTRVLVSNNLFVDIGGEARKGSTNQWGVRELWGVWNPRASDIVFEHNTADQQGAMLVLSGPPPKATGVVMRYNIAAHNTYGVFGNAVGSGTVALDTYLSAWAFEGNVLWTKPTSLTYPSGNFFTLTKASVGFLDAVGGNYRLSPSSPYKNAGTDGKDLGADIDAINTATACAISGACGGTPPPSSPPPPSDTTPPSTPTSLSLTAISQTQINLSWTASTDNIGVTGYRIYRNGSLLTTNNQQLTTYSDTGLSPSTSYSYTVSAYDAAGNVSAQSSSASATTLAPLDIIPPILSAITASSITSNSAIITLTTDEPATTQVEYGLTSSYGSSSLFNSILATSHSVSLSSLSSNSLYHYRVKSQDASLNLATSLDNTFTTSPAPDTQAPNAINNLSSSNIQSTSLTVSWQAPSDSPSGGSAASYDIRYSTSLLTSSNWNIATQVSGEPAPAFPGSSQSYIVAGLNPQTTYYVGIKSQDVAGNISLLSNVVTVITPPLPDTTPPVISSVTVSSVSTIAATITWTTNESSDSQVEYGLTSSYGSSSSLNSSLVTSHSITLSSLASGTTYHYRVKSKDASGNLASSGDFIFTTSVIIPPPDITPPVISAIQATKISSTGAVIIWTTDESSNSQVEYGLTTAYGSSTVLDSNQVTSHSVSITNLNRKTTYHYRVKSKDATGNLAVSGDNTFTTSARSPKPSPVKNLQASQGSVIISWTNPTDYEFFRGVVVTKSATGFSLSYDASNLLANTQGESFADQSVTANTTYYYSVFTYDDLGVYSDPANVSFTPSVPTPTTSVGGGSTSLTTSGGGGSILPTLVPTPSKVNIYGAKDQVLLTWQNPTDSNFVRVKILRKENSPSILSTDGAVIYEGDREEFTDTQNLKSNTTYYYTLFSLDRNLKASSLYSTSGKLGEKTNQEVSEAVLKAAKTEVNLETIKTNIVSIQQSLLDYLNLRKASPKDLSFPAKLSEIQKAILAVIEDLRSLQGASTTKSQFTRTMFFGMRGSDVTALQQILIKEGLLASGKATGYFGFLTREAVKKFQIKYNIVSSGSEQTTGFGLVGPKTRERLGGR